MASYQRVMGWRKFEWLRSCILSCASLGVLLKSATDGGLFSVPSAPLSEASVIFRNSLIENASIDDIASDGICDSAVFEIVGAHTEGVTPVTALSLDVLCFYRAHAKTCRLPHAIPMEMLHQRPKECTCSTGDIWNTWSLVIADPMGPRWLCASESRTSPCPQP